MKKCKKGGTMQNKIVQFRKQPALEIPDDLITINEFATKYGCAKSYIYRLRDKNALKLYKIGYYKVSEAEALRAMGN